MKQLAFRLAVAFIGLSIACVGAARATCSPLSSSPAGNKIGIVIAQSAYSFSPLSTPQNDAEAIAQKLADNGYSVFCYNNLDSPALKETFSQLDKFLFQFSGDLFFYFSGHGWNDGGTNYFIGTDAVLTALTPNTSVNLDSFVQHSSFSKAHQLVFIFDVCRSFATNGPLVQPRNIEGSVGEPKDIVIAYSAGFGTFAYDGSKKYSPFGGSLAAFLNPVLGLSVQEILELTAQNVRRVSEEQGTKQLPSIVSFSTRQMFLDTRYSGLKGLRSFDEARSLGIVPLPSEGDTTASDKRTAEKGVAQLIKDNRFGYAQCRRFYRSNVLPKAHIRGLAVRPVPKSVVDDDVEQLYAVRFDLPDNPCVDGVEGNYFTSLIGLKRDRSWGVYWSDWVEDLAVKEKEPDSVMLIARTYVGSRQVSVKLLEFDHDDLKLVPSQVTSVPISREDNFFELIPDRDLLGQE